jgi:glycosyltransferase involved in cell wall biosynthesis
MTPDIRLSVALLTRNQPDSLARCLASLRAQEAQPYEVVVSDDSSGEGTASETRDVAARFGCRYVAGPRRGLYANRNSTALQCTGTHIRTMDDDHTFPAGHFAQCLAAIARDPEAVWTTGEMGFIDGKPRGGLETATQLHPSGAGAPVDNPDDNWAISDGSTIYPRKIFDQGMLMLECFSYGPSYLEFGAFLYHHGWRSRCMPGAWIEHHIDPSIPPRNDACSRLYASLCFNLFFRPDFARLCRYAGSSIFRNPTLAVRLPGLVSLGRNRWSAPP